MISYQKSKLKFCRRKEIQRKRGRLWEDINRLQLFRFELEIIISYQKSKLKFDKRKEIQEEDWEKDQIIKRGKEKKRKKQREKKNTRKERKI